MMGESKLLYFLGSSRKALREFPLSIREDIGYALYEAQCGGKPASAKPLKGFGGGGGRGSSACTAEAEMRDMSISTNIFFISPPLGPVRSSWT